MNRKEERELFLKYLVDVYFQNPNLLVSSDLIYNELSRFASFNGEHYIIDTDSLVGVQVGLNNKFRRNDSVNTFSNGYFWVIENRLGNNDKKFISDMYNSIKIYVSVDPENIYKVSELLFNFMISEGIVMQCKISKGMRNDALVCRVSGEEAARKVSNYLNNLNYKSRFRPNPFLLDNGKVSVAKDGRLSYNSTLAKLLSEYFNLRKSTNSLDKVDCNDFNNFVKSQIDMINSFQKVYFMNLYKLDSEDKCKDFIMICNLISKNLNDTLTIDEIFGREIALDNDQVGYAKQLEDKVLYVINGLSNYYSVQDVHKILMKFIENGDFKLFTRREDIRTVVVDNFTPESIKKIISDLGWQAFISASRFTYDKYGEEQVFAAIKNIFNGEGIQKFTNDYGARSRLGLVIPPELLKEVIISKLSEKGMNVSSISLATLVLYEISKLGEKKIIGRK